MPEALPEDPAALDPGQRETEKADSADRAARMRRTRSVASLILVILASLGVVASLLGFWVRTTLFDTEAFMEVVDTTLTSEEVTIVVGDAVSEQVITALDLEARLEARLSAVDTYISETLADALNLSDNQRALLSRVELPSLAALAPAIAEPLERRIEESVEGLVASDGFQERLPDAIAFAHRGAVALIREDTADLENVSIVNGEVRWNTLPLVADALSHLFNEGTLDSVLDSFTLSGATYEQERGEVLVVLGESLGTVLPADFGQITVMSEERLETWQSTARRIDRTAVMFVVVTIALVAAALALSRDRRRTLVQVAVGIIVALLAAAIAVRNVHDALDAALPGPPEQAAVDVLFEAVIANLRTASWIFVAVAAIVGISAHLAGHPAWLEAIRKSDSGHRTRERVDAVLRDHSDAFIVGGIAAALLVWWWVGINMVSFLVVGLLLGGYLWYLTRLVTAEDGARAAGP